MNARKKAATVHTDEQKERQNTLLFEAGKFCLDIAKLIFAGVILASLMKQDMDFSFQFALGILAVGIFCFYGFLLIYPFFKEIS